MIQSDFRSRIFYLSPTPSYWYK